MNQISVDAVQAKKYTVAEFFARCEFRVPKYQREYAWKKAQIEDLLNDLWESYSSGDDAYYVLGQVITSPRADGSRDLVDGQQRLTSLYLLLLSLRRHAIFVKDQEEDEDIFSAFEQLVNGMLWSWSGAKPTKIPRFHGPETSRSFLEVLVRGGDIGTPTNESERNVKANFEVIRQWILTRKSLGDSDGVWSFGRFIAHRVLLVSLDIPTEKKAIDFFVKLNSRGKKLNAADLLKGMVLKSATPEQYESANEQWQSAARLLEGNVAPKAAATMEFLLGAMIRKRTGKRSSKEKLYQDWEAQIRSTVVKTEQEGEGSKGRKLSVEQFMREVILDAEVLANIACDGHSSKTPKGIENNHLSGTRLFKAYQHYTVLLAGRDLNANAYMKLSRLVEARVILSLFSEEPSQDLERTLPGWSQRIGKLTSASTVGDVVDQSREAFKLADVLLKRVDPFVRRLRYQDLAGKNRQADITKIRYILATVSRRLNLEAKIDTTSTALAIYLETRDHLRPLDVDHIFPKSKKAIGQHWNPDWQLDLIDSLGNLVLLQKRKNIAASDKPPADKVAYYRENETLLLTQALEPGCSPTETSGQIVLKRMRKAVPFTVENWSKQAIDARANFIVDEFVSELKESIADVLA
mgnify:CR=1 FL=1